MQRLTLVLAVLATALVAVGSGEANVPNGKGLEQIENTVVPLDCEGEITTLVYVTRGGGATGWRAEPQNQHHVLSYFSITVYYLGVPVNVDEKSWGLKSGIGPLHCSQTIPLDASTTVVVRGTIHPLPDGGE